jgi:hypothetical protein
MKAARREENKQRRVGRSMKKIDFEKGFKKILFWIRYENKKKKVMIPFATLQS